jgi:ADP-ribose pyrophosphatase
MADDLTWATTDSTVDYTCPGFDVRRDEVRLPDGTETDFHYVDEPAAVVVLPFTTDGDVVVIDEWRQAVGRVNRGLPAGTVEAADPTLSAAARRELREETGHEADGTTHLFSAEPTNGIANSVHHYFVARNCVPAGDPDHDFNESIRVSTVDYDDLLAAVLDGSREDGVRDGRTVAAVTGYELRHGVGREP